MTIKFENPPINELVIGTYFNPPLANLRNEHIGLLWSKFRDEFPTVTQQPPIGDDQFVMMALGGEIIFPMPRWFISDDQVNLLQNSEERLPVQLAETRRAVPSLP